jgi:hypothetical protein
MPNLDCCALARISSPPLRETVKPQVLHFYVTSGIAQSF